MSSRHSQPQIDSNLLSRLENVHIKDESSANVSQKQQAGNNLSNRPLPSTVKPTINYSCVSSVASNYPGYEYHHSQEYASGIPIYENIDLYEPTYITRNAIEPQMAHGKQLSFSSNATNYDITLRKTDTASKAESRLNEETGGLTRFTHTPQPSDMEAAPIYENFSKKTAGNKTIKPSQ